MAEHNPWGLSLLAEIGHSLRMLNASNLGRLFWIFVLMSTIAGPVGAEVIDRVVATVDSDPIMLSELERFSREQQAQPDSTGRVLTREEMLDAIIMERLMAQEIKDRKIKVSENEIDSYIEEISKKNNIKPEQMERALAQQGFTVERYREQVRSEIQKMQILNREVRGRVNVTPQDVERYYEAHKEEHVLPARIKLRHIVLRLDPGSDVDSVQERIEAIRSRIVDDDESFEEVAKEVSEDAAASEGGDLGEVEPSKILSEFDSAIRDLDEGEVSQPIRTQAGFHLLRVDERIPIGYTPIEELAESIREDLYAAALDKRYRRWLFEDLKKSHFVETQL